MRPSRPSYTRKLSLRSFSMTSSAGSLVRVHRFDGVRKSRRLWDSLRKDEELWIDQGNCLVHLYAPDTSRRGPSLKIPLELIEQSDCPYLFGKCIYQPDPPSPSLASEDDNSDSGYGASISGGKAQRLCELYIPAPVELTRHEAFLYHIGTRNYFAYLLNKPLVGERLGDALSSLASRIEDWQPDLVATTGLLDYCQEQGYLDFAENVEYSVASLVLAEQAHIASLWVDAFAHCVGMHKLLDRSSEAKTLDNTTWALISRAALEMHAHIGRATTALGTFLEDDLGPNFLGLSKPLRNHLDLFRSFLHSFYVNQVGYFPPDEMDPWDKRLWSRMYEDFQNLYQYLADKDSSHDRASGRGLNGGICVTQNLMAFDTRHAYSSLPHPLPLEPEVPLKRRTLETQRSLRSFKLGRSESAVQSQDPMTYTLAQASNTGDPSVLDNRLVREYIRFEGLRLEGKISLVEARKVRWILVYGVLQTLIVITRAPTEVQDTIRPSYPLCIPDSDRPTWMINMEHEVQEQPQRPRLSAEMEQVRRTMEQDRISIHPDCEADCAEDFFSTNHRFSRTNSDLDDGVVSSSSRPGAQLSRTTSIRSSVNSLQHSIVGSFSRRGSFSKRLSGFQTPSRMSSFREEKSDNSEIRSDDAERLEAEKSQEKISSGPTSPTTKTELEAPREKGMVPTLELHQLGTSKTQLSRIQEEGVSWQSAAPELQIAPPKPRVVPTLDLEKSTTSNREDDHDTTEDSPTSGQAGPSPSISFDDLDSSASEISSPTTPHDAQRDKNPNFHFDLTGDNVFDTAPTKPATYQVRRPTIVEDNDSRISLHAGCYIPTGADGFGQFPTQTRTLSSESVCSIVSSASSQYPDVSQQAAEIEEEEFRGRQRLRGLGRSTIFGVVDAHVCLPDLVE